MGYKRIGSVDSPKYAGPVYKYKVAYLYFKKDDAIIEAFDMYFCFYKNINQTLKDHVKALALENKIFLSILKKGLVPQKHNNNFVI